MTKSKGAPAPKSDAQELSELWEGQSTELLKALHILTRDGKLNQDSRRKLKQVQHLVQLIRPHLKDLNSIADLGAGKSYLGFVLYDLELRQREETQLWAIEQREALVESCRSIAKSVGFDRVHFRAHSILEATKADDLPATIDAVTALHACDVATDEAIAFALDKQAKFIALVPCCQAEAARLLNQLPAHGSSPQLWRHSLHRREFGSHLTNVIRALYLESRGYKVTVTELIGWEHSMKNELILAVKVQGSNGQARKQLNALLEEFPLPLRLFELAPLESTPLQN